MVSMLFVSAMWARPFLFLGWDGAGFCLSMAWDAHLPTKEARVLAAAPWDYEGPNNYIHGDTRYSVMIMTNFGAASHSS